MKIIDSEIEYNLNSSILSGYPKENLLFFDIETTGFSSHNCQIYMIGLCYFEEKKWHIKQYLSDEITDEYKLLESFISFIKNFSLLVHYNGDSFDIPFIINRCNKYNLDSGPLSSIKSFDVYKYISPLRKNFPTKNLKLKSMELFLGIQRNDKMDGKKLINIFKEYIADKNVEKKNLLLLHNFEDLTGLLYVSEITNYIDFFKNDLTTYGCICSKDSITFYSCFNFSVPADFSFISNDIYINMSDNKLYITINVYSGELKYFFNDYKNYYYLELEDMAIHKSVASYVDKSYRTPATASTCYVRQTGRFIPVFDQSFTQTFKIEYKDKISYVQIPDNISNDNDFLYKYINSIRKSKYIFTNNQ